MNTLKEFSIPVKGLKNGKHEFKFELDASFFQLFETSPVENAQFEAWITLEKSEEIYEFTFDFEGTLATDCDRCLAAIQLPIEDVQELKVKISLEKRDEEADIVYISPDEHEFNVAQYLHEFICLALPLNNVYDCQSDDPQPCDQVVLKKMAALDAPPPVSDNEENPFSDLKDLFNKN